jgi:hypothetical protein
MKKLTKVYFAKKRYLKWLDSPFGRMKQKLWGSFVDGNVMGSRVFMNEKGQVEVKILTAAECFEVLDREKRGELISEEYTIYN